MSRTANATYRKNRAAVLYESTVCYLCGRTGADTVDHLIPWSVSHDDSIENLAPAHSFCNKSKGKKTLAQMAGQLAPKRSLDW